MALHQTSLPKQNCRKLIFYISPQQLTAHFAPCWCGAVQAKWQAPNFVTFQGLNYQTDLTMYSRLCMKRKERGGVGGGGIGSVVKLCRGLRPP